MAKQQTNVSKYPSRYSPEGWVTPAQYITEIICENKHKLQGKGELPVKFWETEGWAKYFKEQIATAHKLLKTFKVEAISRALKTSQGRKIFSLRAPWLPAIIQDEQTKLDAKPVGPPTEFKTVDINAKPVQKTNKNILDKLRDLDG
jgi:hypothetical protein